MPTARRALALALAAALAAGCADRPKAPPLTTEAVYRSDAAGVRFLVPDGWVVTSRAEPPAGPLDRVVVMATYVNPKADRGGSLHLVATDQPADADPAAVVAGLKLGPEVWAPRPPAVAVAVNGADATRVTLARTAGATEHVREATVFRRGPRAYVLVATFATTDRQSRDAVRRAVESAAWDR